MICKVDQIVQMLGIDCLWKLNGRFNRPGRAEKQLALSVKLFLRGIKLWTS